MADVRAYFQVAYKRIIDYIPLTIEHELDQAVANALYPVLIQSMFTEGMAEWRGSLVAEDPAIAAKRDRLKSTEKQLTDIKRRLAVFERDMI